jgi:K+-sensing histidine kinase KdpD
VTGRQRPRRDPVDERLEFGLVVGILSPIATAAALVGLRGHIQNANIALLLVVVVVFAATVGGRAAGAAAALTSAAAFTFFHTKPYLRLTIASADDVETTVLLLVVGVTVGHVAARGRSARDFVRREMRRINAVAEQTARGETAAIVVLAAEAQLRDLLHLRDCRFEAPSSEQPLPRLRANGTMEVREHHYRREGFELPAEGVELPVHGHGRQLGRFVLIPTPGIGVSREERMVAVAIAGQVGSALADGPD